MVIPSSFPIGTGHTFDVPYVWQTEPNVPRPSGPALPRYDPSNQLRIGFLAGGANDVVTGNDYCAAHAAARSGHRSADLGLS
jgi:hypothetical protein